MQIYWQDFSNEQVPPVCRVPQSMKNLIHPHVSHNVDIYCFKECITSYSRNIWEVVEYLRHLLNERPNADYKVRTDARNLN